MDWEILRNLGFPVDSLLGLKLKWGEDVAAKALVQSQEVRDQVLNSSSEIGLPQPELNEGLSGGLVALA